MLTHSDIREVKGPSLYCSTSAPLEVKPEKLRVRMNHGCVKSNNTKSQCPDRPSHERQSCLEHSWADHSAVSVFTEMVLGSIASCENRLFLNCPRLKQDCSVSSVSSTATAGLGNSCWGRFKKQMSRSCSSEMMPPLFRISMTLASALYSASSIIGTHSESD